MPTHRMWCTEEEGRLPARQVAEANFGRRGSIHAGYTVEDARWDPKAGPKNPCLLITHMGLGDEDEKPRRKRAAPNSDATSGISEQGGGDAG